MAGPAYTPPPASNAGKVGPPPAAGPARSGTSPRPAAPTRGHWVAGNDGNWVLIHAAGPGHWVQGGVPGAQAPAKPKGMAPPPNNPLEPWGNDLVRQQATKEIQGIYGPEQNQLNQQRQVAQNIYQKQQQDNQWYTQWAASQAGMQQAHQDQVNQSINQVLGGLSNPNQLTAGTALGSEAAQGSVLANTLNSQAANNQSLENTAIQGATGAEQAANTESFATSNIAPTSIQNTAVKQLGAFTQAQNTYNQDTQKLQGAQNADILKEIVRLQGVQSQKAQYEQNLRLTADKLGLQKALDQGTLSRDAAEAAAATQNAKTAAKNADTNALKALNQTGLDKAEVNRDNAAAQASLASANYKQWEQTHAGQAKPPTLTQTAAVYGAIDRTRGAIQEIINNGFDPNGGKLHANQAYQILKNGGKYYIQSKTVDGKIRYTAVQVPRMPNLVADPVTVLNAAYNLATLNHISAGDLASLNKSGIYGVRQRYNIGPGSTPLNLAGAGSLTMNPPALRGH